MDIQIDKNSRTPLYDQIKYQITSLIQAGKIKMGDQLPTIRDLAAMLAVNVNTVALAYRDLSAAGVIITTRGRGTFVAAKPGENDRQSIRNEKLHDLIDAFVKETDRLGYSREEVGRALVEQFRREQTNKP